MFKRTRTVRSLVAHGKRLAGFWFYRLIGWRKGYRRFDFSRIQSPGAHLHLG